MVWTFWNKYSKILNFLDRLKGYNRSVRPYWQFSIHFTSYIGLWPSLERYTSSPLKLRLKFYWTLNRTMDIWITLYVNLWTESDHYIKGLFNGPDFRHLWITPHKDCFTNGYPWIYIYLHLDSDLFGLFVRFSWITFWKYLTTEHLSPILNINR